MTKSVHSQTADFLRDALNASRKTQREIAQDAGFPQPNVISMMKKGQCKVPISRIPRLAIALGIDVHDFLDIALREYNPEIWLTLKEAYAISVNDTEQKLIDTYQMTCCSGEIIWSPELEAALQGVFLLAATGLSPEDD